MAKQDLIPLNKRTPEERREIARKGGSVQSPAKKLAAKIRGLKWVSDKKKAAIKVVDLILDSELNAVELMRYADTIKGLPDLTPDQHIRLLNAKIQLHKAIHGDKKKIESSEKEVNTFDISTLISDSIKENQLKNKENPSFDD